MAAVAQISWIPEEQKYHLLFNGKKLTGSQKIEYLEYLVRDKAHQKVRAHGITHYEVVSRKPSDIVLAQPEGSEIHRDQAEVLCRPTFSINERFDMLTDLIKMVINKNARSVLLTGEGGVGKTHTVLTTLADAGKVDVKKAAKPVKEVIKPVREAAEPLEEEEEEAESELPRTEDGGIDVRAKKATVQEFEPGDFVVMKGHTSAAGMYEFLYTYRDKIIIFDDCDSVLRDGTAINLLKAALDTYDERWLSWNTSSNAIRQSSVPTTFLFTGSIIFISNMSWMKVDEAVRTRCHGVDVSMTNAQRIERMAHVLENIMPEVDMELKHDAINLMDKYKDLTTAINFRKLMDIISIRKDPSVSDWERLALFSLVGSH